MDLAYDFLTALHIPKSTIQNQYAYQVFKNPKAITKQYFDIIPNSSTFIPQDGDIGVFDATPGNIAGHIGVCLSGGTTNTFPFFEQNLPIGSSAHITPQKKYTNFLGVLRPKNQFTENTITDQTKIPQIDNMEVQAIRSERNDQIKTIKDLNKQIKDLEDMGPETIEITKYIDRKAGPFGRLGDQLDSKFGLNEK